MGGTRRRPRRVDHRMRSLVQLDRRVDGRRTTTARLDLVLDE